LEELFQVLVNEETIQKIFSVDTHLSASSYFFELVLYEARGTDSLMRGKVYKQVFTVCILTQVVWGGTGMSRKSFELFSR